MIFDNFVKNFFSYTQKCLRIRQLDIIKKFKKSLVKGIKIFLKKEKTKRENVVANDMKISQKIKSKNQSNIEKHIMKCEKIKISYKQRLIDVFQYSKHI